MVISVATRWRRRQFDRSELAAALHVFGLWSLAVTQPLLDLLGRQSEFFVARGTSGTQIVMFVVVVTLIAPAMLILGRFAVVLLFGVRAGALAQYLLVGVLAALLSMGLLGHTGAPSGVVIGVGVATGFGYSAAYVASTAARTFAGLLALSGPVFVGWFLFGTGVTSQLVRPPTVETRGDDIQTSSHVLVYVFDELPLVSLLAEDGTIDARRFPNFAKLAKDSVWYRDARTVSGETLTAIPALVTGDYPRAGTQPNLASHPDNLFTMLGGAGFDIASTEPMTDLCPDVLCVRSGRMRDSMQALVHDAVHVYLHVVMPPVVTRQLPSLQLTWSDFANVRATLDQTRSVEDELARLRSRPGPFLNFVHNAQIAHFPWRYIGTGQAHMQEDTAYFGYDDWPRQPRLVDQAQQLHLVEAQFADRIVGLTIDRLKEEGLYDSSVIVFTADHGITFRAGIGPRGSGRRGLEGLAYVPMFIRAPSLKPGVVDDRDALSIDVLPTIADLVNVRPSWDVDGQSLVAPSRKRETPGHIWSVLGSYVYDSKIRQARDRAVERKFNTFGDGPDFFHPTHLGALLGLPVDALDVTDRQSLDARYVLDRPLDYVDVDPDASYIPVLVTATIEGNVSGVTDLAVAVNGSIAAVAPINRSTQPFRVMALVPPTSLRHGRNEIRAFAVVRDSPPLLAPLR